jgi:hypothetical protein
VPVRYPCPVANPTTLGSYLPPHRFIQGGLAPLQANIGAFDRHVVAEGGGHRQHEGKADRIGKERQGGGCTRCCPLGRGEIRVGSLAPFEALLEPVEQDRQGVIGDVARFFAEPVPDNASVADS